MQTPISVPGHIAVVLDGNRRWAKEKGFLSWEGHAAGAKKFEQFLDWCMGAGVKTVSAYVLSSDNLRRSKKELQKLFDVMCEFTEKWLKPGGLIDRYEVKINFVGNLKMLPSRLSKLIERMTVKTAKYSKRILNILIAYSGKEEIAKAMGNILKTLSKHTRINITPKMIEKNLSVDRPVDLVIRTGGQSRLSNFLLWQTAYAEMYTTETLWPDFSKKEFTKAISWFSGTQRNFGR